MNSLDAIVLPLEGDALVIQAIKLIKRQLAIATR